MSADEVDELWAGSIDTEGEAVATPTPLAGSYSQPKPPDTPMSDPPSAWGLGAGQPASANNLLQVLSNYFEQEKATQETPRELSANVSNIVRSAGGGRDRQSPPQSARRRKRTETGTAGKGDVYHDITSGSDRDGSPIQLIRRPAPNGRRALNKEPWRLYASPSKTINSIRRRPDDDEESDDGERGDGEATWHSFIERQDLAEKRRQWMLAKSRSDMRVQSKRESRPGPWLQEARRYFKGDDSPATRQGSDFLERMARLAEARKVETRKLREERDMEIFGPGGPNVRCMNRRSKQLLARREKLAKGKARIFERLYQSSKSFRAEKIISGILLDKGVLSDGPRKLRTRRRSSLLRSGRWQERGAVSDGDRTASDADDWYSDADGAATVDGAACSREKEAERFHVALKERLRSRLVATGRLPVAAPPSQDNEEEPAPLLVAAAATEQRRNSNFRKRSRKLLRQRVEDEIAVLLRKQGQENFQYLTQPQAEDILVHLHVLPPKDDGQDLKRLRLVERSWAFLRSVTEFELSQAAEADGSNATYVSLQSVVMLVLRVATEGRQTVKNPVTGQHYHLKGSDVELLAKLRDQHLLLRLGKKATPAAFKVFNARGQHGDDREDSAKGGGEPHPLMTSKPHICPRSEEIIEELKKKNTERLRHIGVHAPGVYHTWLAQADLKVIQKVVGGEGAGETSVDLQSILAHSNEALEAKVDGQRLERLQEEMKECTFTPALNKKTVKVMKARGRPSLQVEMEEDDESLLTSPRLRCRSSRHNDLHQEGRQRILERRGHERLHDPQVQQLRQVLKDVEKERERKEELEEERRAGKPKTAAEERQEAAQQRKKEEQERREQEVAELVEQLKASGLFKPTLPQYDPATLEPPTNEVKSYQQVVERLRKGHEKRQLHFNFNEQLRKYQEQPREQQQRSPLRAKVPTVPEPFRLSPRRELKSHVAAHQREQRRVKDEEEKQLRARRLAREVAEAVRDEALLAHQQQQGQQHAERAVGGGEGYHRQRRGDSERYHDPQDPLLFVDVVLSGDTLGDSTKIRVPVLRGDSPRAVAHNFGSRHNLTSDAVRLLEMTFRTHMAQTLRKELLMSQTARHQLRDMGGRS